MVASSVHFHLQGKIVMTIRRRKFLARAAALGSAIRFGRASKAADTGRSVKVKGINPLVMMDDFHRGLGRSYSLQARVNAARTVGFDGIELIRVDGEVERLAEEADALRGDAQVRFNGVYWMSRGIIDS